MPAKLSNADDLAAKYTKKFSSDSDSAVWLVKEYAGDYKGVCELLEALRQAINADAALNAAKKKRRDAIIKLPRSASDNAIMEVVHGIARSDATFTPSTRDMLLGDGILRLLQREARMLQLSAKRMSEEDLRPAVFTARGFLPRKRVPDDEDDKDDKGFEVDRVIGKRGEGADSEY